jgi:anti-sigma B factor antagonist
MMAQACHAGLAQHLQVRLLGTHVVVSMPAEIDVTNASQIRQALDAAATDASVLIVDMSECTFCDSAGVEAIIAAHKQATLSGTQLSLVASTVRRIFTLCGADQLIPFYPSVDAALAAIPAAEHESGDLR